MMLLYVLVVLSFPSQSTGFVKSLSNNNGRSFRNTDGAYYHSQMNEGTSSSEPQKEVMDSFDDAVMNRYACTRFQRYDNRNEKLDFASPCNPKTIQVAYEALDLARRAPSGFNIQPYKVLLVSSKEKKEALARYCIGHNAHRVRDSDCTAIFLADRQVVKTFGNFSNLLKQNSKDNKTPKGLFKMKLLIAMFSSGFPFPKWLSGPASWVMRFGMRLVSWVTRGWYPLPTLTSSETWSQKNTMLAAMTYLLACSSRQTATCPMEGFLAWGIRNALKIPRRYTIPLIVATGSPYIRTDESVDTSMSTDDAGVTHGPPSSKGSASTATSTPRFQLQEMVYDDIFGNQIEL